MANAKLSDFTTDKINGRAGVLKKDLEMERKMYEQYLRTRNSTSMKYFDAAAKEELRAKKALNDAIASGDKKRIEEARKSHAVYLQSKLEAEERVDAEIASLNTATQKDINSKVLEAAKNMYAQKSAFARQAYQEERAQELAALKETYEKELAMAKAAGDAEAAESATRNIAKTTALQKAARDESRRLVNAVGSREDKQKFAEMEASEASAEAKDANAALALAKADFENTDEMVALQAELDKAKKAGHKEDIKAIQNEMAAKRQAFQESEEYMEMEFNAKNANAEATAKSLAAAGANIGKQLAEAPMKMASAAVSQAVNAIESNFDAMFGNQARVNTRLQGAMRYGIFGEFAYNDLVQTIQTNVGMSGTVSQKDVVARMVELADQGIAYNLETRAFLASTAESIASTFDVFDSNLMRLIRIQQADTTAARMGMEASLTRLFNTFFSDSSYMNKGGAADQVTAAIMDAMSQMNRNESLEFEYTLQKWLGSLYSVGLSDQAVSTIATGINYLGTGNVSALNSNDALQTLLAMSAARAGKSYADLLTGGLSAEDTNDLLKAMVEYLAEIAKSQENMVTKSAYADLFGMSITDLSTFQKLTAIDNTLLHASTQNYVSMMLTTEMQLATMIFRENIGKMIDTAMENAVVGAATTIGNNPALYGTWKVLNIIEGLTGGIQIPAVEIYGFMVDLHTSIEGLAKAGIAGLGMMGSLMGSLFNGSLFGTNSLYKWGYDSYTNRGGIMGALMQGVSSGLSQSSEMSMTGSSSGEDVKTTSMNDGTQEAQEDAGTTSEEMEEGKELNEKIYEAIAESESKTVITELGVIAGLLAQDRVFYTAMAAGGFNSSHVNSVISNYGNVLSSQTKYNTAQNELTRVTLSDGKTAIETLASNIQNSSQSDTMSDMIYKAFVAALMSASTDLVFKSEIENNFGNPIAVTATQGVL